MAVDIGMRGETPANAFGNQMLGLGFDKFLQGFGKGARGADNAPRNGLRPSPTEAIERAGKNLGRKLDNIIDSLTPKRAPAGGVGDAKDGFYPRVMRSSSSGDGGGGNLTPRRSREQFITQSSQIRKHLGIKPDGSNVGIADYNIDGQIGTLQAVSRHTNKSDYVQLRNESDRRFYAVPVGGGQGPVDTEAKILEEISSRFNPNSSGRVVLFTDRPPCPSCWGVIDQFRQYHPNIEVDVIEGDLPLNPP